jgi:hypothetical protein
VVAHPLKISAIRQQIGSQIDRFTGASLLTKGLLICSAFTGMGQYILFAPKHLKKQASKALIGESEKHKQTH